MAIVPNAGTKTESESGVAARDADVRAAANADLPAPTSEEGSTPAAPIASAPRPQQAKWFRLRQNGTAMARYLLDSEVHTFAFSVAANAILSFIPLTVLLYTLALSVFHSQAMAGVVNDMVNYFLPSVTRQPNWLASNLEFAAALSSRHGVQALSLLMILISCTGIFLPLEVALNQAWGVRKSRNYLLNQAIAFGLAIWMVVLGMTAMLLSAGQRQILAFLFFHHTDAGFMGWLYGAVSYVWLAICTGLACILFFFSIYWILPNCKVPAKSVMRSSIVTGLVWLGARIVFVDVLPHLDLKALYGPFYVSVGLLFWAYISGLILFAGAQVSVARMGTRRE
ncbi:MAG: YihY/virulence factor BrkB family protein [Terracidiphilus sp.]